MNAHTERLRTTPLRTLESEVTAKRRAWFAEHRPQVAPTPRAAYELLFFDYMRLDRADLPVLDEDESRIVWASRNTCPTLDACRELGLDTRKVCREAYEKSTQAFVSLIDPRLRFLRDYEHLRPYGDACVERIELVDFDAMLRIAIEEARQSRREGNKGYGAVATLGNRILARAHDTAITAHDASLHAEVNVLREAAAVLGDANLSGVTLFSSCEPCPMCASLAVWSNVSAIIFGASIEATAARGKLRIQIPAREVVERSPAQIEVIGGVLEAECMALY